MKKNRTTRARVSSAMKPWSNSPEYFHKNVVSKNSKGNRKQKKLEQEVKDFTVFGIGSP